MIHIYSLFDLVFFKSFQINSILILLLGIEKKFFISKYHLCHIFPGATGLTVYQYITKKRLAYARELIKTGMTISASAEKAGFNNYSSFYRAYMSEYNTTPQTDKKK